MIDDGNKHILKLHDVSPEEAASFTVQAGPVDSSADLTVKGECSPWVSSVIK